MTDRFKFRAYNKELRKMYEVDTICPYEDNHTKGGEVFLKGIQYNSFYFPEEVELMQSTGLKDKNGKLIYEGDVIENLIIQAKYIVVFSNAKFMLKSTISESYLSPDTNFDEVIGNIYENKELLNENS